MNIIEQNGYCVNDRSRKHLAIVLDEFGGTDAIVSHEDLIEATWYGY